MMRWINKDWRYKGYSIYSWSLIILAILESIIIIFIELMTLNQSNFFCRIINVYISIFIFSRIFQLILAFDAIKNKNTIQLIGLCIFNIGCFGYSIIQVTQLSNANNNQCLNFTDNNTISDITFDFKAICPLLLSVCIILGLISPIYCYLTFKLYKEYGWEIYKKIGAHTEMKNMFLQYHILMLLLKVAFFFFMGFSLQFLVLILSATDYEFWLNILAFPVILLILVLAIYGIRYENKMLIASFIFGLMLSAVYFCYKLVRIYYPYQSKYDNTRNGLTVFAVITLLLLLLTAYQTYVCYRNFNHGLSEHIKKSKKITYLNQSPIRTLNLGDD
ncbi:hypothetical protein K502DRAFT_338132, partial [Neoconidiobolus thromboides FSU 785]